MPEPKSDIELILDALGDGTRRKIVDCLSSGPATVSALAARSGVTLTAVAQHLRVLETARLCATEKVGRVRTCRLETQGFDALSDWAKQRRSIWDTRVDRLAALFEDQN